MNNGGKQLNTSYAGKEVILLRIKTRASPPLSAEQEHEISIHNVASVLEECFSRALGTNSLETPKANRDDCENIVLNHMASIQFTNS